MKRYLDTNRDLYVYGYGNLGRNAFNKLKSLYSDRVKGIVVTKYNKKSLKANDIVYEVDNVKLDNALVIIATNSIFHQKISYILKEKRINYCYYTEEMDDYINSRLDKLPLLETRLLSICVGQVCNYKCRDCVNMAPYAKKDNLRYDLNSIIRDMDVILPYFQKIEKLHIQGGEPFLYSELDKLLQYIEYNYKSILGSIQIATNGEIMPNDKVLKILSDDIYDIRISNYKNARNVQKVKNVLEQKNIKYHMYDFANGKGSWNYSGDKDYIAPESEDIYSKVLNCNWCMCYTVENGLVGRCARSIPAITIQNLENYKDDYLNLNSELNARIVGKYFMFIKPMTACKHCMGSDGNSIEAAIQI